MIVTYAHRHRRSPRKRKLQPLLSARIVTAKAPDGGPCASGWGWSVRPAPMGVRPLPRPAGMR
jgi:hypothetical protein